ncbi:hypothetical protein JD844_013441 [Phrynosoma platyrhinos]|uniref:Uncharacterized protein n=1 Tax=Phrynosoma platyrhinos TaxID=52577 RepID=A0ABQ7TM30_PHRPL|nr:hypothetical protein JD844_013441 [Phrynosoma platyrhinos]
MAEAFHQDLTCAVCLDLFTEPVLLGCGHCFCKKCITAFWDAQNSACSCPECRAPCLDRQHTPNRLLGNLAKKAWEMQERTNSSTPQKTPEVREKGQTEGAKEDGQHKLHCDVHGESLELFCTTDETPICFYCINSFVHAGHSFSSLKDGAQIYKEKLDKALQSLKTRITGLEQHKGQQKEKIRSFQNSAASLRADIRAKFSELHQILHQRQSTMLAKLDRDEKVAQKDMTDRLEQIRQRLQAVKEMMTEGKSCKELNNPGAFLSGVRHFLGKLAAENGFQPGGDKDDLLLEPLQLDLNTAHPIFTIVDMGVHLIVQVQHQKFWNDPQRFQGYQTVCGKNGFAAGKHYWEIETGDITAWFIGVTIESIAKKTQIGPECWKDNIWAIELARVKGISPEATSSCWRFGVYLDYEEGQVSFYNVNYGSHLGTHRVEFKEKVYPFFCHFASTPRKNASLTICQKWYPAAPVS